MTSCVETFSFSSPAAFVPSSEKSKTAPKEKREDAPRNVPEGHEPRQPEPGPRPNTNPNLDSFEAVMQAMDAELAKKRTAQSKPPPTTEDLAQKAKEKCGNRENKNK